MALRRCCSVVVLASALLGASVSPGFSAKDASLITSGLPVPRFVSLKSDHVNVRVGPTKDNDVTWIYTRSGLPVEITAEFENWRRIRDSEGAEGWVYHSLLSGRRTAVITMKTKDDLAPLYDRADPNAAVAARLQAGRGRPGQEMRGRLVPRHRHRFRRLDRTAAAVGRLSRREGGLVAVVPASEACARPIPRDFSVRRDGRRSRPTTRFVAIGPGYEAVTTS